MLRHVVLHHSGFGQPHFDLMFETSPDSLLATWRSDRWPIDKDAQLHPAGDHRRAYLDYEGPVSGDRGVVRRIAAGTHVVLEDAAAHLVVQLESGRQLTLRRA